MQREASEQHTLHSDATPQARLDEHSRQLLTLLDAVARQQTCTLNIKYRPLLFSFSPGF